MIFDDQFIIWVDDSMKQQDSENTENLKIKTAKSEEAKLKGKIINFE